MPPVLERVDVLSAEFAADPHRHYARWREETPVLPVRWMRGHTAWVVTRHADVDAALRDPRLRKNPDEVPGAAGPRPPRIFASLQRGLLSLDGPDHDRLRRLVHQAFTPRRIERIRDDVQQLADDLLDRALERGTVDLISDYAAPLPVTVIARILGVPERDGPRFRAWTQALMSMADRPVRSGASVLRFVGYLRGLIRSRAREPHDDLVTALVQARDDQTRDGLGRLSTDEIVALLLLLLTAGHETTVNLIGLGTLALLEHPEQADRWRADQEITRPAVEELLRFTSPVTTATERWAAEDLEIAGTTVPRGALVLAALGSANRDPAAFPDPDTLDLTRTPNPHLAFGKGAHYCLGAPLARLEAQIALPTLLRRAPRLRLAAPAQWRGGAIVRGLRALPVDLG